MLVQKGILKALTATLKMKDARILAVALEGIENILKSGQTHFPQVNIYKSFDVNYREVKRINSH